MTTYNQASQSVNSQTNVGRDQIIHNLVIVGQFLDFARIEGLVSKNSDSTKFNNITEAFEKTFEQNPDSNLSHATATAGEIFSDIMLKWTPKQTLSTLPAKEILSESPELLYNKFLEMGIWNTFYSISYVKNIIDYKGEQAEVIWLQSLETLWKKRYKKKDIFGIAKYRNPGKSGRFPKQAFLCRIPHEWGEDGNYCFSSKDEAETVNLDGINYDQFRIIIAGLVIDTIRMCSIASDDIKFWQGLISMMGINKN